MVSEVPLRLPEKFPVTAVPAGVTNVVLQVTVGKVPEIVVLVFHAVASLTHWIDPVLPVGVEEKLPDTVAEPVYVPLPTAMT